VSNTRLTVVVRRDLHMPEGLLAAQVAHIAALCVHNKLIEAKEKSTVASLFTKMDFDWMVTPYLSVLAVECFEDLMLVRGDAKDRKLPVEEWYDTIPSPTFDGDMLSRAFVGLSIGPADFDAIKLVTARLSVY